VSQTPPSRRMADALRQAILSGELAPGAKLPSERSLAQSYGAARNTARQAIAILQAEGLVEAQHGRGVFVRRRPPLWRLAQDRYARRYREAGRAPFRTEAESQGRRAQVQVTDIEPAPAPFWVARRLGLREGEQVLLRKNRYLADDEPVQLANTYVHWDIAEGTALLKPVPGPGGIYATLESLGHQLVRMQEDVSARMPLPDEAAALRLGRGVPVLELIHTSFDQDGQAFEVTQSILPADRNLLAYDLPVD
jgi:GntR family transcriptional regulator